MTRSSVAELAVDLGEDGADIAADRHQDRNSHHRDEGQDQGVFHQGLTLLALELTERGFRADNNVVDHFVFHLLSKKSVYEKLVLARLSCAVRDHLACQQVKFAPEGVMEKRIISIQESNWLPNKE